jgi:DNA invertase Pin-like site-specific DNA recombinase
VKNKIRKCGYARVSTLAEEQEHSLINQTEYYKQLIGKDNNSIFVGIYADRKSGRNTRQRPQFMEMIKAAKRGEIDYIITKSISRFARNLVETLKVIRELRELSVGIYFENESIDTLDATSDFIISIYSTIAESELTSMSENVKWAARKRFRNGSVELNSNIYGYTLKEGQLTPEPEEAVVVKEMFERYAKGEGYRKIANRLNDRGIKKKLTDKLWKDADIKRILGNEKYVGDALLQKSYKKDFKQIKNNGEVPQYYVENNHEPIVDRETYEKVQEIMEKKSRQYKQAPAIVSPFSGKIKCKSCDGGYRRKKNNRNTPYEKWIWSCSTYIDSGREHCKGHNIREDDLKEHYLSAYNEAASFESHEMQDLGEAIKDLLAQERELIALRARKYLTKEAYDEQHEELLKQLKEYESEYAMESRRLGDSAGHKAAFCYTDRLVRSLELAEIDGYKITFKFKNGAVISRIFNNHTNRKATWAKKLGGVR